MNGAKGRLRPVSVAGLTVAIALCLAPAAFAQDAAAADDPFAEDPFAEGAFDAGAGLGSFGGSGGASEASAPYLPASSEAKIEYLVGGTATVSASAYVNGDFDGYAGSSAASGKLFAKVSVPDRGSLFASYVFRQYFFKGLTSGGPVAYGAAASLSEPSLGLSELYYSFDVKKAAFFRLGKQLLAWGPSFFWTPVDFVNAERADPLAAFDGRSGTPGLKATVPLGMANVVAFADFSRSVANGQPLARDPADALVYSARADMALGGFEWGVSGSVGRESQGKAGFDFSGYLWGTTVYGELATAFDHSGYDPYSQVALGFSRALGDLKKWTLSGEGLFNSDGATHDATELQAGFLSGEITPFYAGKWYANASLKAEDLLFAGHDATLSATANFSDRSYQARFQQDIDAKGVPPFTLVVAYSGGGEGKEFTGVAGDGALEITLRARLEF